MIIHVIKPGDTIYQLAEAYQINPLTLIEYNHLDEPDWLVPGQTILIPEARLEHIVARGDTIYTIARTYGVSVSELLRANPEVENPLALGPGTVLEVPSFTDQDSIIVNGYAYPTVSEEILRTSLPFLTYLSIFSYEVTPEGELRPINDQPVIDSAAEYQVAPKMVLTNIDQQNGFSSDLAHAILIDEEIQDILLSNAILIMEEKGYSGLDIDFEYLYPDDRDAYNAFLQRAQAMLHGFGYTLSTAIAPKLSRDQEGLLYEAHDYAAHGEYDDFVILMTYEWGYLMGPPMAVAPIDQVRRVIEYAVTEIPPEKILMGIPNYGYDWTLPFVKGTPARVITNVEAVAIAKEENAEIQYDETAQSPFFTYRDAENQEHIVWFEDARSIQAKMDLVKEFGLRGISYWTVNYAFPQNWAVVNANFEVEKKVF